MHAQAPSTPEFQTYQFTDGELILGMSDNGEWAVAYNESAGEDSKGKLINIATQEVTELPNHTKDDESTITDSYFACDVTDDGVTLVGCFGGRPAAYREATGWRQMPMPAGFESGGEVRSITPDGKYAVGYCTFGAGGIGEGSGETAVMWDMNTMSIVPLTGLPTIDLAGETYEMSRFMSISADGRYLIGCTSYIYMNQSMVFIYDRQEGTWTPIGHDYDADTKTFTPKKEGIHVVDQAAFSPNGEWVGGTLYMTTGGEYKTPYRYHISTGEFTLFDELESHDMQATCVDDLGNVMAGTPSSVAVRTFMARCGNYWFDLNEITTQCYGTDFYSTTGFDYTGTPIATSADGRTLAVILTGGDNYIVKLPETLSEATQKINLLATYTATPADGSSFASLQRVDLTFNRNVAVVAGASATLRNAAGDVVTTTTRFTIDDSNAQNVIIQTRHLELTDGEDYTLTLPAGALCVAGDTERLSPEIVVHYTGRANKPVELTSSAPSAGTMLSQLNASTNYVVAQFDTQIQLTDTARAALFQGSDPEPVCELELLPSDNRVALYPTTTQYLFLGSNYTVRIFPGSLTDLTGGSANETIEINYAGAYERTISSNDSIILNENFDNGLTNMMLYDGDRLVPVAEMTEWGFSDNMPWSLAADGDNLANTCAVSHSMYNPAGKSDDWMVTPQCYIPDDKCVLRFRSQGYRNEKTDYLKVIVYADETVYNNLTATIVEQMRTEGDVVYYEQELPGRNEDVLVGDWVTHTISLAEYAGRSIYVAFVNENEDQSAIFIDDLTIDRATDFTITLAVDETLVAASSMPVRGRVEVTSEENTFSNISISLLDASSEIIETVAADGLSLADGDTYPFAFETALPLTVGQVNRYGVRVEMGDVVDTLKASVRNMAFEPLKRIVVEEYTGMGCPNCPQGHLALERLDALYGDRVIPVAYHVYSGDIYHSDLTTFVTSSLGMSAAPSAVINRDGNVYAPMYRSLVNGLVDYSFNSPERTCWLDVVGDKMGEYADADIHITASYDSTAAAISIPYEITYALDQTGLNLTLQIIVTEDGLVGYQDNNLYTVADADLGRWGQGEGSYGSRAMPYTFNHVARSVVNLINYGDLVPSVVEAEKTYTGTINMPLSQASYLSRVENASVTLLLLDVNTGRIINAASAKVTGTTDGIHGTMAPGTAAYEVTPAEGGIQVTTSGEANVTVFTVGGTAVASCTVNGTTLIPTGSYEGIAIVRVTGEAGTAVKKIMVK